jgi:hypothetical protein
LFAVLNVLFAGNNPPAFMKTRWPIISLILCAAVTGTAGEGALLTEAAPAKAVRVYSHLLAPREHPDYARRAVKPPDWDTFGRQTQFTTLRGFNVQSNRIVGYAEELDKFSRVHALGNVIWPSYPILFATNLGDLAEEIKRRGLYLFDIWGYVPGSGPGGYWQQFKPPAEAFATLEAKLGERWLGTDIGEQDGRYVGGYANQMTPASASRFEQYLNFQRHFERMGDELGHKHATLVSLNFGHYFLKEGTYTLIGAETAQALPNNQVYYAFIRGAGKQYGVPWFGNASIFNRWGYKVYGSSGRSDGYDFGPTKGTSLSLMKRLLYSHLLYNGVAVGFENGWFEGDRLSPIGQIQQSAQRWFKEHGPLGVLHTPVALLLDFYAGWTFPRHLYTDRLYRVWGNLPYEPGDFETDALLHLLYPGYADSSYFHDETGFITATPYGDIADCLLSDAPLWLLARYPVLILAGDLRGSRELRDKLEAYAAGGGVLVLTAANLRALGGSLAGAACAHAFPDARETWRLNEASTSQPLEMLPLSFPSNAVWLAEAPATPRMPLAIRVPCGRGHVIVLASRFGAMREGQAATIGSHVDQPLERPWSMYGFAREILASLLQQQRLFEADPRLALLTCRKGRGEYTVGILNNTWRELPLRLQSHCGEILSQRELPLDQAEKSAVGYLPEGLEGSALGRTTATTIAGGDVRVFAMHVKETGVEEIPHLKPPARPAAVLLPLRAPRGIKEEVLQRPTFFEHFGGVVVDWRYLHERETAALARESAWIKRQGLRVAVDLSPGVNLYPALRLIDNLPEDYSASMSAVTNALAKMQVLGATDLLFSLHRRPENNFTAEQTAKAFETTLKMLAAEASSRRVALHLRLAFGKPPGNLAEAVALLDRVGATNLKLAPSTALLVVESVKPETAARLLRDKVGFWLASAPRKDHADKLWDVHAPLHASEDAPRIHSWLKLVLHAPIVLDALYPDADAEYLDAKALSEVGFSLE